MLLSNHQNLYAKIEDHLKIVGYFTQIRKEPASFRYFKKLG